MKSILFCILFVALVAEASFIPEGYVVHDPNSEHLKAISMQGDLVVDHVNTSGYEVYGPVGLGEWLDQLGVEYFSAPQTLFSDDYPTSAENEKLLKELAARHSDIMTLFSIGKSSEGKELWVMKISDNPNSDEDEPEFKYIANMHGNEIVGRELMIRFIEDIGREYNTDAEIKQMVDSTEIFIMPSMNPDGADRQQRANANHYDLNRDFPDFSTRDNENTTDGRQPETVAVMNWQARRNFKLSANFHGGAECVNYPWDTVGDEHPQLDFVKQLSINYANTSEYIANSSRFPGGITNGYHWYEVNGGMQDWSSHWHQDLQVTVELSRSKWPEYSKVEEYYQLNKPALIEYIQAVHSF